MSERFSNLLRAPELGSTGASLGSCEPGECWVGRQSLRAGFLGEEWLQVWLTRPKHWLWGRGGWEGSWAEEEEEAGWGECRKERGGGGQTEV